MKIMKSTISLFMMSFCLMGFNQSSIGKDIVFKNPVIGEFEVVGNDFQPKENRIILTAIPQGTKFRVVHVCSKHTKGSETPYKVFAQIDTPELKDRIVDASSLFINI